jgi:NADPH:quinone reductase-like Zn-dependent oxidoreductase
MVSVRESTVIDAPIEEVWPLLRDFNGHRHWHPAVAESEIEDGKRGDEIGAVRRFRLKDGSELREQLLTLSDRERRFVYCILESPIPLIDYVATVRLKPVTDGARTFWEWSSRFRTPPGREAELATLVGDGIYRAGFDAIKERLGQAVSAERPRRVAPAGHSAPTAAGTISCQAVILRRHGGPEALEWGRIEVPPPAPGEVRLRHTAIGLNFIDIYTRTGYFPLVTPPAVIGMEAAGIVTDIGDGVTGIAPGERVAYAGLPPGAYSEMRCIGAELLVPLPDDISDETAAAGLLKGMSAEFLLHRVHLVKEGDVVLVHAAAGGVGELLCQWASHLGATVIGTVSSAEKAAVARRNGCAYPIVTGDGDFVGQVMAASGGHGADVIYDAIGRDNLERSYEALALRGHLISFGQAAGPIPPQDVARYAEKSATLSRPNFGHYAGTPQQIAAIARNLFEAIRRGILTILPGQRYPLAEAARAHRDLEERRTIGPSVLLP